MGLSHLSGLRKVARGVPGGGWMEEVRPGKGRSASKGEVMVGRDSRVHVRLLRGKRVKIGVRNKKRGGWRNGNTGN